MSSGHFGIRNEELALSSFVQAFANVGSWSEEKGGAFWSRLSCLCPQTSRLTDDGEKDQIVNRILISSSFMCVLCNVREATPGQAFSITPAATLSSEPGLRRKAHSSKI